MWHPDGCAGQIPSPRQTSSSVYTQELKQAFRCFSPDLHQAPGLCPNPAPVSTPLLSRGPWGWDNAISPRQQTGPREPKHAESPRAAHSRLKTTSPGHEHKLLGHPPYPWRTHTAWRHRGALAPTRETKTQHRTGSGSPMGVESGAGGASSQMNSPDPQATVQRGGPMGALELAGLSHGTLTAL